MKLFYKNKILISGIFPLKNHKIDGYIQKTLNLLILQALYVITIGHTEIIEI